MKLLPLALITVVLGGIVYFGIKLTSAGDGEDQAVLAQPPIAFPDGIVEFEADQRSDVDVPGTDGVWIVHLGDITEGQVEVTVRLKDGAALLAATSLEEGDGASFRYRDRRYRISILELDNHLVGTDRAKLEIGTGLSETERIQSLLRAIENAEGMKFFRNGEAHNAKDAADHLRRKWKAAQNRVGTAEVFIERLASSSSLTGEPYVVETKDGTRMPAGEWFKEQLAEIDEQLPE